MRMRTLKVHDSSHISMVVYDFDSQTMFVEFASGSVYRYDRVNPEIFGQMAGADSIGTKFSESVKFNPSIPFMQVADLPENSNE